MHALTNPSPSWVLRLGVTLWEGSQSSARPQAWSPRLNADRVHACGPTLGTPHPRLGTVPTPGSTSCLRGWGQAGASRDLEPSPAWSLQLTPRILEAHQNVAQLSLSEAQLRHPGLAVPPHFSISHVVVR